MREMMFVEVMFDSNRANDMLSIGGIKTTCRDSALSLQPKPSAASIMSSHPEQIASFLPPVSSPSPARPHTMSPLAATLALRDDNGGRNAMQHVVAMPREEARLLRLSSRPTKNDTALFFVWTPFP
jgi:hypothetical protein